MKEKKICIRVIEVILFAKGSKNLPISDDLFDWVTLFFVPAYIFVDYFVFRLFQKIERKSKKKSKILLQVQKRVGSLVK